MAAAIIAYRCANTASNGYNVFQAFAFVGRAGNGVVQVGYIGLMMFAMVNFHGHLVKKRLQGIGCIWKRIECKWHTIVFKVFENWLIVGLQSYRLSVGNIPKSGNHNRGLAGNAYTGGV